VLRKSAGNKTKVALRWTPEGKRKPGPPKGCVIRNEIPQNNMGRTEEECSSQSRQSKRSEEA
jgi:hypothetical protein